jgi:DNA mismatch endonuclease (patch repair protein)
MQRQRRRDTKPELEVRRRLHRLGLRYRVDYQILPTVRRRADLAFTRARVAVFVDGCFWHRCPAHGSEPRANAEFWRAKLDANQARDRGTDSELAAHGWRVIRIWEHEDPDDAAGIIATVVRQTQSSPGAPTRGRAGR